MALHNFEKFRRKINVTRKSGGRFVDGLWVEGTSTTFTITGDIQSWKQEELDPTPEGRRIDQTARMYSREPVNAIGSDNPDVVEAYNGVRYEVMACYPQHHGIISHYKSELKKCEQGL